MLYIYIYRTTSGNCNFAGQGRGFGSFCSPCSSATLHVVDKLPAYVPWPFVLDGFELPADSKAATATPTAGTTGDRVNISLTWQTQKGLEYILSALRNSGLRIWDCTKVKPLAGKSCHPRLTETCRKKMWNQAETRAPNGIAEAKSNLLTCQVCFLNFSANHETGNSNT